jgi:hypothetical protein
LLKELATVLSPTIPIVERYVPKLLSLRQALNPSY